MHARTENPEDDFIRAVYANALLDKAEKMLAAVPTEISMDAVEDGSGESMSPSAWDLKCYQESFEEEVIKRDLFQRLSNEAKEVLWIFLAAPTEITEALLDICLPNERGRPRRFCKTRADKIIYKPERVKTYLRRFRRLSNSRVERVFSEVHLYLKDSVI